MTEPKPQWLVTGWNYTDEPNGQLFQTWAPTIAAACRIASLLLSAALLSGHSTDDVALQIKEGLPT